jgi:hypothetical protein
MDEKNKKQTIFAVVLGIVLVVVLIYQFGLLGGSKPPAAGPASAVAAAPAGAGAPFPGTAETAGTAGQPLTIEHTDVDVRVLLASLKQEPINYKDVRIQRDPMQPLVGKVANQTKGAGLSDPNAPPEPPVSAGDTPPPPDAKQQRIISAQGHRITAIVWDARSPVAVVDDEIVSVGYTYPDGVQVHAIEPSRVVFKVDESLITVEMKEK